MRARRAAAAAKSGRPAGRIAAWGPPPGLQERRVQAELRGLREELAALKLAVARREAAMTVFFDALRAVGLRPPGADI